MDRKHMAQMRLEREARPSRQARGRAMRSERDLSIAGFALGACLGLAWFVGLFFGNGVF